MIVHVVIIAAVLVGLSLAQVVLRGKLDVRTFGRDRSS